VAVSRLGVSWPEFDRMSPLELAWRLWGERRRRNVSLRYLAWAISTSMAPHVAQGDRSKVAADRLFMSATGGDLDLDEVI
jgi:hypothetical protein